MAKRIDSFKSTRKSTNGEVHIQINDDLANRLRTIASSRNQSMKVVANELLTEAVEQEERRFLEQLSNSDLINIIMERRK